jgi:hypothetical protein
MPCQFAASAPGGGWAGKGFRVYGEEWGAVVPAGELASLERASEREIGEG